MTTLLQALSNRQEQPTRVTALLIGSATAIGAGVAVHGHAPVTRLCRELLEARHDPALALDVYRGTVLCLRMSAPRDNPHSAHRREPNSE
jgi:hypothetical protein